MITTKIVYTCDKCGDEFVKKVPKAPWYVPDMTYPPKGWALHQAEDNRILCACVSCLNPVPKWWEGL